MSVLHDELTPSPDGDTSAHAPARFKVVIALQYYRPHRTGLTLHAQHLAEALAARGHDVTVIAARHDRSLPRRGTEHGVTVLRLWAPLRISRGMLMPTFPVAFWRQVGRSDVVSIHTPMLETGLAGLIARLRRVPMVITHHGDLVLPPGRLARWIERGVHRLHRFGARVATTTIAYSADYAEASRYIDESDAVEVIAPPVRIPRPDPGAVEQLRRGLSVDGGPVLLFAGRFVREKRPDLAIRALEIVRSTHPHARLVFAGEFEIAYEHTWHEQRELVAAHREALVFLGRIDDPQRLADTYAAADVLVLTSDTECYGMVQPEAMLCGTPVVMTDIPGGRVPVRTTGMGQLARAGDADSIAKAIVEVLEEPHRYVHNPECVIRQLGLDRTIDRYEQVFHDAAR